MSKPWKDFTEEERDKARSNQRAYYVNHRGKMLVKQQTIYEKKLAGAGKQRRSRKPHEVYLAQARGWYQIRMQRPNVRLACSLRTRVSSALRGARKAAGTSQLIGCSLEDLREHLESQFKPGMSWENHNYRGWHVDHVRPLASFDLTDPEQQRQAFRYSNLQPLWMRENLSKGAKIL